MIEIGINGRSLAKDRPAGVGRYTRRLIQSLGDRNGPDDLTGTLVFGCERGPVEANDGTVRSVGSLPPNPSGASAHLWEQFRLPRALSEHELDVFHTPAGVPPLLANVPLVTTFHDLSPIARPEWFSRSYATLYRAVTPLAVRRSERIIAVSEFTRDELVDRYPRAGGKTTVVHNGVRRRDPATATPVDELDPDGYFLFVGAANPRKNLATLLRAYGRYRSGADDPLPLALAGPQRDVFAATDAPEVDGVHRLGYVPEDELTWLYHNAAAFVYPSLYEGFGLPILEAMSAGTPVITSDRGAMAEVAGDAARLVDPEDPNAIAAALQRIAADNALAEELATAGERRAGEFSWADTAHGTIEVYRDVAGEGTRTDGRRPLP